MAEILRELNVTDVTAPGTPWIAYGGSLAGAYSAFTMVTYGSIFYGGIASSGVVHAQTRFSEWQVKTSTMIWPILIGPVRSGIIQKYAPQDCVSRISGITAKMDSLVAANNTAALQQLQDIFGLGSLDIRQFAETIVSPSTCSCLPLAGPLPPPTKRSRS